MPARPAPPATGSTATRYRRTRIAAFTLVVALAMGCGVARHGGRAGGAPTPAPVGTVVTDPPILSPVPAGTAPARAFAVGVRTLSISRGAQRPLPTTVWYPATGTAHTGVATARAAPAAGRFPVVVFSHGLTGLPGDYTALLTRWAAAGFVIAAPAYPHTSRGVPAFDVLDVVNQPADASAVLTAVLALDGAADPLRGHLDTGRVGAAGHSAGAITTVGLFTSYRDGRLRAGIVLAGNAIGMGTAYRGAPSPMLFVHGDKDPIVPYATGQAAYQPLTWPKAFFTLTGAGHIAPYLSAGDRDFAAIAAMTIDFWRYTLYGDVAARGRLASDAGGRGPLDNHLV